MTYLIHIQSDSQYSKYGNWLTEVANSTLTYVGAQEGELTVVLCDERQIRELNRKYRNLDQPTDVLSFKDEAKDPDSGMVYFGDVIIAAPFAEIQAASAGHSIEAELSLLTIHGILHLLDYDHSTKNEKARMWAIQSKILHALDLRVNEPR